jgi:hypothetical protein
MANYSSSTLVKAQAKLFGAFQAGELRYRRPDTYLQYLRNAQIMYPSYDQLRTREDRTIEAYYRKRTSRSLSTGRSHNHTGAKGDSGVLTPSWTTYSDPFVTHLKQGDNNMYSLDEMFANEVENVVINFLNGLETLATSHLFSNRTQVFGSSNVDGTWDGTNYVFTIGTDKEKRAIQITKSIMDIEKFGGNMTVFCDTLAWNKFNFYANQGNANNENTAFQFAGLNFVHSPELYALFAALGIPYVLGSWCVVPDGMIAALPHIPKQNVMGVETKVNKYGIIRNPVDGLNYAVHEYLTLADGTATGGYTQDVKTEYQVSLDIAFDHAPLSTSNAAPIYAFAFIEPSI